MPKTAPSKPSTPNTITLPRRISELLTEKGDAYSIRSFAPRIGIGREVLRRIVAGERHASPSELKRIAMGLGITIERLKQTDTHSKQSDLATFFQAKKRTKPMILRAHSIASEWVESALGATERAESLNALGRVLYLQQRYEDAHETWLQAMDYAKQVLAQHNDKRLLQMITANLMLTYTLRKEYSRIEELLQVVEGVFQDDPQVMAMAQYTRMKVQENRGNLERAKDHAYRCFEYIKQTKNEKQISHALINMAHYENLLQNYTTASNVLSDAISRARQFDDILIRAVKEYVKSLLQLREYETAKRVIEEHTALAKEYPDYRGKLQLMYTTATGNPSFAEAIANDTGMSQSIRYFACKCLMEFYTVNRDFESAMRYYEKSRIYSINKSEYLNEEGF